MSVRDEVFPLVPRRRLMGLAFGTTPGGRRGVGSDVAGSRPYVRGDSMDAIDWSASARASAARGTDEFIVREHFADDAPRVVMVVDRRPEMALTSPDVPWLRKDEALRVAATMVASSVAEARGLVGYLDFAEGADAPFWRPPASSREPWSIRERHLQHPAYRAPEDNLTLALEFLEGHRRSVPGGTFLFVDVAKHLGPRGIRGFLEDCLDDNLVLAPGDSCGRDYETFVRICFTAAPPEVVRRGVAILAKRLGR